MDKTLPVVCVIEVPFKSSSELLITQPFTINLICNEWEGSDTADERGVLNDTDNEGACVCVCVMVLFYLSSAESILINWSSHLKAI